ncbi:GntR family transcriptional regulator [Teichococcus cervicalis]|uniref:UbiC transcription regulator-associated domain protein n=1 Tax=Pseudoroseomonas cervicalis ATCC 49957 TaxID=525371 RepID=D5RPH5_9PROT|nr:GntR family transcriptional regulator [Pseudoroseomonas cervicalis]EFH10770.1 UbiC transcription regulator-associated domain protein [Pseudoroseomonas cervicalis ATCC 49957]
MPMPAAPSPRLDARPLYRQVEDILIGRIVGGDWPPGHLLPSEPELAAELGVSQGTVRKALAALEQRHLIDRRQGRGTTVARHTSETARYTFFRVRDLSGRAVVSRIQVVSCVPGTAESGEAALLGLEEGAPVIRLRRIRLLDGSPRIFERCTLSAAVFPGFSLAPGELPTELYVLFQRSHGVTVSRAEEELSAAPADAETAAALGRPEGTPLLMVQRIAYDVADRAVEVRLSMIDTERHRYAVRLD